MDVPGDVNSGTNALNLRMDVPSGDQADLGALGAGHPFILVISRPTPADLMPTLAAIADQSGTVGTAYSFTLPEATGGDTPITYALTGSIPAGLSFVASTQVLSGTPTTAATAVTLTYTATDNDGDTASRQFDFVIAAAPSGDEVVVDIGSAQLSTEFIVWSDNADLGDTFSADGNDQELTQVILYFGGTNAGLVNISIVGTDRRFTADFEATGLIIFEATVDGETLEVMIADADMTEPYSWTPSNSQEVIDFATHVSGLNDRSATMTLRGGDDTPDAAPSFTDNTGDDQDWVQNTAITSITVPAASGAPAPTYAVQGSLPAGIAFNTTTRVISGTPTAVGSGTITIRASNSEGNADWTVDYTTTAPPTDLMPTLPNVTRQDAVQGTAFTITLPEATGGDTPLTYSLTGTLPTGVTFTPSTRVLAGTPTQTGTFGLTYRVEDVDGDADTDGFNLRVAAPADLMPTLPNVADQVAQEGTAFTFTIPTASSGDTPLVYSLTGTLPNGITFTASTRVLAGTPTEMGDFDLTYTVTDDDGDTDTADFTLTVTNLPVLPVNDTDYRILVDYLGDGGYDLDILPLMQHLQFSQGVYGVRREGISAGAGKLSMRFWNNDGLVDIAVLKNKRIRVRYNGLNLWSGRIDDPKQPRRPDGLRLVTLSALGALAELGANVPTAISLAGDNPASQAISEVTGLAVESSSEEVADFAASAGDRAQATLRAIQNSSGTRLYENADGALELASTGVDELWDAVDLSFGDTLSYRMDEPQHMVINAVTVAGTKYTDSDSVDAYGEILHGGDFSFAVAAEAPTIAANALSLYAEPRGLIRASYLMEYIAGYDKGAQNAILRDLHYGNERLIAFDDDGTERLVEILNVANSIRHDLWHTITLTLRERDIANLSLTLNTYYDLEVGYFAQLPPSSADGARTITGHKIEFRLVGVSTWTEAVPSETALVVNDTFTVPTADAEYEVRLVATSAGGDEQTTATQTLKAVWGEPRYQDPDIAVEGFSTAGYPFHQLQIVFQGDFNSYYPDMTIRRLQIYSPKLRSDATDLRVLGFDVQAEMLSPPEGLDARYYGLMNWRAVAVTLARNWAQITGPQGPPGTPNRFQDRRFWLDFTFEQVHTTPMGYTPMQKYSTTNRFRTRPVFAAAAGDTWANDQEAAERGLWTPWREAASVTTGY